MRPTELMAIFIKNKFSGPAVVIGNSQERLCFDLTQIPFTTYGCNALYNDFIPDFLVCADTHMAKEVTATDTLIPLYGSDPTRHPGTYSGLEALKLAIHHRHSQIIIIGFAFPTSKHLVDNVYAGTPPYTERGITVSPPRSYIDKFVEIISTNTHRNIVLVTDQTVPATISHHSGKNFIIKPNEWFLALMDK